MKLPHFGFSLRTLLLATLFAGSVMLCWRVRESWGFKMFAPFVQLDPADARNPDFTQYASTTIVTFSPADKYVLFNPWPFRDWRVSEYAVLMNADSGEIVNASAEWRNAELNPRRDWLLQKNSGNPGNGKVLCKFRIVEIASGTKLIETTGTEREAATFSADGAALLLISDDQPRKTFPIEPPEKSGRVENAATATTYNFVLATRPSHLFAMIDRKTNAEVSMLRAPGVRVDCMRLAPDAQRAAGIVNGNALCVWTRRRRHFEWWGVYEQWEFWLAGMIFGGLLWSGCRDWKEARKIR
jgi:hypothetical protein